MNDAIRRIILALIVVSLPVVFVRADTSVELIKDIHPGSSGSGVNALIDIDGTLFFTADDGVTGVELWRSDGTEDGTVLVRDIHPGPDDSQPFELTKVGGTLFFSARDGVTGRELWMSDGTESGTVQVKDIIPGSISSSPSDLIDFAGNLFFVARVYSGGRQLMRSDGTAAGTVQVSNDYYTPEFSASFTAYMTTANSSLFFVAEKSDGYTGWELWKTDGTSDGTLLVKDINPGPGDSDPSRLVDVNGTLFFGADGGSTGKELWKSDGTESGTVQVKEIYPGFFSSIGSSHGFTSRIMFNDKLYFIADDGVHGEELWESDGTEAGTVPVKDIRTGSEGSNLRSMTVVGDTLFFVADDGVNWSQLWKTDGTTAGTAMVRIETGASPGGLTEFDGMLFFQDSTAATGAELWLTDGTAGGTFLVDDINPGSAGSSPWHFTNSGGTLIFGANDGTTGYELFLVDCPRVFGVCGDPFTVNSVADVGDLVPDEFCDTGNMVGGEHECTLRAAIQESNGTPEPQLIDFEIPQSQATGGVFIIEVGTELPLISDPAVIDATTQLGYQPGAPVVELDGPGIISSHASGFNITAGNTVIRGFSIYDFGSNGITIKNEDGNVIESNIVGTNAQSDPSPGNGEDGILVQNSSDNTIGGSAPSQRNVISRNGLAGTGGCGVLILASPNNRVLGNYIGTDVTGMTSRPNTRGGVCLEDSGSSTIGGTGADDGNVISGNLRQGILITGPMSTTNSILGNTIGLDQTGNGIVANERDGVALAAAGTGNIVGDGTIGGRNIVSGNGWDGVVVDAGAGSNQISGNLIGSDSTGQLPRPNQNGIVIRDSTSNKIGLDGGNIISGNTAHGLLLTGDAADFNQIRGNHIGIDITGFLDLGNHIAGVNLAGVRFTTIADNLIGNNGGHGVAVLGADESGTVNPNQAAARNSVSFNFIGADLAGGIAGNGSDGIIIDDSSMNVVQGNLIQSNGSAGISVVHQTWGDGNHITGNEIAHNIALGIDLGADYVTPNDPMDADTGANGLQNFPEITDVIGYPLNQVSGTLHSTPNTTFTIEIFSNTAADPSHHGEGELFEGAFIVTTDTGGDGFFVAGFGMGQEGECIAATAREFPSNNTSEFSLCVTIPPPPAPLDIDFGDAPDADGRYPTLLANNGARHVVDLGVILGSSVDGDLDGQPNADATGDDADGSDDEDGVAFAGLLVTSMTSAVQVSVNAAGLLNAWVDFNGDGDWSDTPDGVFTDEPLVPGANTLAINVPSNAVVGTTTARFRFSTHGGLGPIGPALDGEVEDYQVEIIGIDTVIFIDGFESGNVAAWSASTRN